MKYILGLFITGVCAALMIVIRHYCLTGWAQNYLFSMFTIGWFSCLIMNHFIEWFEDKYGE